MSSTIFSSGTTIASDWLNDVNTTTYTSVPALQTQVSAPTAMTSINSGPLAGLRNRIINGDFRIAQRGPSAALTTSYAYSCVDRFAAVMPTAAAGTFGQYSYGTAGQNGFKFGAYLQRTPASALTNALSMATALESSNCTDMQGKAVTLSFFAQAGANFSGANLIVQLWTGTGTDQAAAAMSTWTGAATPINTTQVINTTLTRYSFTATLGASVSQVGLAIGYNPTGTAGAADFFVVTGVQLEVGSVATTFEQRPYGMELALCQRYCYAITGGAGYRVATTAWAVNATGGYVTIAFPVPMRTAVSLIGTAPLLTFNNGSTAYPSTGVSMSIGQDNYAQLVTSGQAAMTANQPMLVYFLNAASSLIFSAEL